MDLDTQAARADGRGEPRTEGRAAPTAHTKVVATIGPASEERIGELIDAGMSVARLNFSHGSDEDFLRRVRAVRAEAAVRMKAVGVLADIQGPKMRLARFEGGRRQLHEGERVRLRQGRGVSAAGEVLFDFGGFVEAVRPGERVILADGQAELVAGTREGDSIVAEVVRAGEIGDRKGVHFPDSALRYELPTEQDRRHIRLAREAGCDMIGISFVSKPEEVRAIRELCPEALMVSKIERMAALEALDGLLEASDGIMVARGDLGVEAELEELPLIQKSMIESSRPTRAEVTDVANAVLDGTDAIMLSAETAVGAHPVEAVATMCRIARSVEASQLYRAMPHPAFRAAEQTFSNATAHAAVQAAEVLHIGKIVCFTETGNTVRLISRYRPSAEVIALSPHERTVNHMTVLAHVRPMLFRREPSLEDMLHMASEMLHARGLARLGEPIVFVAGVPSGIASTTNVMKIHRIGEEVKMH